MMGLQENISYSPSVFETLNTGITSNILSDQTAMLLQWTLFTVVCQAIVIFGVGSNIINIVCFVKQGFKDPVNISLLGLAVSDIGCLSTLIWSNICYAPAFMAADLLFDTIELQYMTSGMMHTVFTRITGWITAFITLERCLCITAPLQVKSIVTPKRVSIVTVLMFIILTSTVAPVYVGNKLDLKFFPQRNKTLIGLVYVEGQESVTKAAYLINNVLLPLGSFLVIIFCTATLVVNLKSSGKWRNKFTTKAQVDTVSIRNRKVSKMVVMISALFIVCFIPVSVIFTAISLEPEFFIDGKYKNLCIILGGVGIILESINSSLNIFIYYYMSMKYKVMFNEIFSVSRCVQTFGSQVT